MLFYRPTPYLEYYPSGFCLRIANFISLHFVGRSISVKAAGLIGRHGPQSKQPFMVAFFKASEVLFRSVRAANHKKKNQNRSKSSSSQNTSRMSSVAGKSDEVPYFMKHCPI